MEKMKGFDKSALINELIQGKKYAKELRDQICNQTSNNNNNSTCSSSSSPSSPSLLSSSNNNSDDPNHNNNYYYYTNINNNNYNNNNSNNQASFSYSLLEKMLSSFDKTILIATSINLDDYDNDDLGQNKSPPHSCCISPKSENSHPGFPPSKKRKTMMRKWTKSVKIGNGDGEVSGLQGALDDGFSWRKYGQKDILGSNFPRAYYRCTHRPTKGCVATKQVQKSDEDPTTYQILYRGDHTCYQVQAQSNPTNQAQIKSEPQPTPSPKDQEIYVELGPEGELKVESQQQAQSQAQFIRSFSFSPSFFDPEPIDNCMLSFTPGFGSPTTSGSNYHSVLPYQPTGPQFGLNVQTSETNSIEPVSGPNSFSNSSIISDFEFPIDEFQDFGYYFY